MSDRTSKAARKVEKDKTEDFMARKDEFLKVVKEASLKFRIDLVATMQYEQNGTFPAITIIDIKDKFGNVTPEMQKMMEEQAKEDQAKAPKRDDIIK